MSSHRSRSGSRRTDLSADGILMVSDDDLSALVEADLVQVRGTVEMVHDRGLHRRAGSDARPRHVRRVRGRCDHRGATRHGQRDPTVMASGAQPPRGPSLASASTGSASAPRVVGGGFRPTPVTRRRRRRTKAGVCVARLVRLPTPDHGLRSTSPRAWEPAMILSAERWPQWNRAEGEALDRFATRDPARSRFRPRVWFRTRPGSPPLTPPDSRLDRLDRHSPPHAPR